MRRYLLLAVFGGLLFWWLVRVSNLPYVGPNATNFNMYALAARNYNKYGLVSTKGIQRINSQASKTYTHHPPLVSMILALTFKTFGDSFRTGWLTMAFFGIWGWYLIYKIGGWGSAVAYAIIPASSIFGRLIGQEVMVMFWGLGLVWMVMKNKFWLAIICTILGTLTDWPIVYLTVCLLPWMYARGEARKGWILVATAILTAGGYILYVGLLEGGWGELVGAFLYRSRGELMVTTGWWWRWPAILGLRLLIYMGPLGLLGLIGIVRIKDKLIWGLLGWAVWHVVMYPEGSFGHPYWIYYLTAGLALAAGQNIKKMPRWIAVTAITLALIWTGKVENWKTKEIRGEVWKYELAVEENKRLRPGETILLSKESPVDGDLWEYGFGHPVVVVTDKIVIKEADLKINEPKYTGAKKIYWDIRKVLKAPQI